jgi:hypothetical protein
MTASESDKNLTGQWQGQYSYPIARTPTPFTASMVETGGVLGGSITERSTLRATLGTPLYATIAGRRDGGHVHFTKTYESTDPGYGVVTYDGQLNADATEIEGRWTTQGWSGKFLMIRAGGKSAATERRVEVKA